MCETKKTDKYGAIYSKDNGLGTDDQQEENPSNGRNIYIRSIRT